MSTIYGPDGFDGTGYANGDLATHSNGNWETLSGFGNLNVDTQKLKPNTGGNDGAGRLASWGGSTTAQWAQLTLSTMANFIGPTLFSDGAGTFYFADCRTTLIDIVRVVGGSFTGLTGVGTTFADGDIVYFEAKVNGAQIDLIVKKGGATGTTVSTVSDTNAARITSGVPGIRMWHADAAARIDDYSAGDFSTGINGSLTVTLADSTVAAAGTVEVSGVLSATLDASTVTATGTVEVGGVVTATLAADTLVAAGQVMSPLLPTIEGTLDVTLANDTLVAYQTSPWSYGPVVSLVGVTGRAPALASIARRTSTLVNVEGN